MKRCTALVLLFISVAVISPDAVSTVRADATSDTEVQSDHPRLEQIAAELNLSDEQKAAIGPILRKQVEEFQALQADSSLGRRQKLKKARDISNRASTAIKAHLTPEQQKKYEELRAELRKEMKKRVQEKRAQQAGGT